METIQRRKSGINLPSTMSETSLRLETSSPAASSSPLRGAAPNLFSPRSMSPRTISNLSSSPSSKSGNCSDRFIPCRSSSRLHTFGLVEKSPASPAKDGGGSEAYNRLLRTELFGADFGSFSCSAGGGQGSPSSPSSKNMLRFKTDQSGLNSPYSPSILGSDGGFSSENSTPPKPPRKVPKTPHKVKNSAAFVLGAEKNLCNLWSSFQLSALRLDLSTDLVVQYSVLQLNELRKYVQALLLCYWGQSRMSLHCFNHGQSLSSLGC